MAFISQTSLPGEERVILTNFSCDGLVSAGDWVRLDGAGIAVKAQADSFSNSKVIGLVEDKASATLANILVMGLSRDIFVGLSINDLYFLDGALAGNMVLAASLPVASGSVVLNLGRPVSMTKFIVRIQTPLVRSSYA
jgi:hypothetical protein